MSPTFTFEQQDVIDEFGKSQGVLAGAGSGKTTTLVGKCAALLRRNPKARFAAVSFTEKSAADLRKKLQLELSKVTGEPFPLRRHWVSTIHGFCRKLIQENASQIGLHGDEEILA